MGYSAAVLKDGLEKYVKFRLRWKFGLRKVDAALIPLRRSSLWFTTFQRFLGKCFSSSPFVSPDRVIAYYNVKNEPLPKFYNETVRKHLAEETWFIFCHQDFVLREDLRLRLKEKDTEAVYGPIGVRLAVEPFLGEIVQANNEPIGTPLIKDTVVQTLDAQCLIAHASVFRQGLWFDERFRFHFYDADFCMSAYTKGFDVLATQINCQHKSRTLTGDVNSPDYLASLADFKEKWKSFPAHKNFNNNC